MLDRPRNNPICWIISIVIFLELYGRTGSTFLGGRQFELIDDIVSLFALLILVMFVFQKAKIKHAILNKPIVAFLIVFIVSAAINEVAIDIALMQLRSYILMISLYYLIVWGAISNKVIIYLINLIVLLSIPIFISAIVEYLLGRTILVTTSRYGEALVQEGVFRSYTLLGNPIDFSNFAILILAIILASLFSNYNAFKMNKNMTKVIFLAMFLTLFMSNSRGPIIAFVLSLYFVSLVFNIIPKKNLVIFSVFFLVVFGFFGGGVVDRLVNINFELVDSNQYRIIYLIKLIDIFLDNPFFGVGPGMYGGWVSINYSESYIYDMYGFTTDNISSIDMFFPHVIGELGLLGFVSYLGLLFFPFVFFKRRFKFSSNREGRFVSLIVLLIIPMLFFIGWFSISLETQLILSLYMILLGLSEKYMKNI